METNAIEVKNVIKTFSIKLPHNFSKNVDATKLNQERSLKALDDISFSVSKGKILGIIGLNGSGKTTLLRIIAGIYKPDSGTIRVSGRLSPLMQLRMGFHPELTAQENIIRNGM